MKRKGEAGFTLLEVMVSVAVMAVGVVPLLVTHSSTVANIRRAREMTVAALLARDRMAELEAYGFKALSEGMDLFGSPGDDGDNPFPFLKAEEKIEEIEPLALLEAEVSLARRFRRDDGKKDPAGAAPVGYIVNLYFEPEEESALEE